MGGGGGNFQKLVTKLTLGLLIAALTLVSILMVRLFVAGNENPLEIISTGVVLLVASIPIAMQVVCTSTMAVGAHKLAQREALVAVWKNGFLVQALATGSSAGNVAPPSTRVSLQLALIPCVFWLASRTDARKSAAVLWSCAEF